eukprot:1157733-Pelagomonas_calceolata.AAC.6
MACTHAATCASKSSTCAFGKRNPDWTHLPAVGAVGTPGPAAGGAQRGHHYRGAALPTFRCWLAH